MAKTLRRVAAVALTASWLAAGASAQAPRPGGPALPAPVVQSIFPAGVNAGGTVELTLRGKDLEGATRLWFDHPGLRAFHLKGLTFRVACAPGTPVGHHDVRAVGTYGLSNPRTFVVGDRAESAEIEPNNAPATATAVTVNSVVNGETAATDVDYFAFEGKAGQRVLVDLEAERIDSRLDGTIRLFDASGRELVESRDAFGADPFLDVTIPADGRYLLKLNDVVYKGSSDHVYRLTLTDGPHLDAVVPAAARAGEPTTFALIGRNLGGDPAPDLTADGRPLERRTVTLTPPASGLLGAGRPPRGFVPAQTAARRGFEYTLASASGSSNPVFIATAVDPVVTEREPNDGGAAGAQEVGVPCVVSGCFGARGDLDVYRFRAKKGDVLWVEAVAERIGSAADPTFSIQKVDAGGEGKELATGDDMTERGDPARFSSRSVDAAVRWLAPEDGVFQVAISDLYGSQRGDVRLSYLLHLRPERPDFHLFLLPDRPNQPDALSVPAGGRALASVLVVREDAFSGAVRVEAVDLPGGVRCEPVVIPAGHATAPIVFEADGKAAPALGTVRLVGRARFGDRKDDVAYVSGVTPLGPDVSRESAGGGVVWPLMTAAGQNPNQATPPARLTRGFVLTVTDPAPLTLSAVPRSRTVTPGGVLLIDLAVERRGGFGEAVTVGLVNALTPVAAPARLNNAANANAGPTATIAKADTKGTFALTVPKTVAPGVYSLVLRGTGTFPFSKDPAAKTRPNVTLAEPSNVVTVVVRPAPATLAVKPKAVSVKAGGAVDVEVTTTMKNGAAGGPVTLSLAGPPGSKLSAEPVHAEPGKAAKLVVKAAADVPAGAATGLTVRATVLVRGEPVDVDEPLALTVTK